MARNRTVSDCLTGSTDPAVCNYLRWKRFNAISREMGEQSLALRDGLLKRHGLPPTKWEKDPDQITKKGLDEECEYYSEAAADAEDATLWAPVATPEGALAKIEISIHLLRQGSELSYEEQKAFSVLYQLRDFLAGQIEIPDAIEKEAA